MFYDSWAKSVVFRQLIAGMLCICNLWCNI